MYMKVKGQWYEILLTEAVVDGLDPEFVTKALDDPKRFRPLDVPVSAKSIGSRRALSTEKDIVAAYTQALKPGASKRAYDKARVAWGRYRAGMQGNFRDLVSGLSQGNLTKSQFITQSRSLFKAGYETAYRLGTDASGLDFIRLPSEDLKWLSRARSHEYKFLDKFADDVVAGRGRMPYDRRADMYIDSTDSVFDAGRVDAYPNADTWVHWEMGAAEHCGDCVDLALNSPYRPDDLPTTPGAGGTRCLSNCQCHLRIVYEKPREIGIDMRPASRAAAKALGLLAVGTTAAVAKRALDKAQTKRRGGYFPAWVPGEDDEDELEFDMESKWIDWNRINDAVSALTHLRVMEEITDRSEYIRVRRRYIDEYTDALRRFPDWLDPFSRDVYVLHQIGEWVLDKERNRRKEGVE